MVKGKQRQTPEETTAWQDINIEACKLNNYF